MPRRTRTTLIRSGRCRTDLPQRPDTLPMDEQYERLGVATQTTTRNGRRGWHR